MPRALSGEPCHELASVIFARRALRGVAHEGGPAALLSRSYEDSRKRLWLCPGEDMERRMVAQGGKTLGTSSTIFYLLAFRLH